MICIQIFWKLYKHIQTCHCQYHVLSLITCLLGFLYPDVVETVTHRLKTWSSKRIQHSVEQPSNTPQFYSVCLHVGFTTPNCTERQQGEIDSPENRQGQTTNKGRNSVTPQLNIREELKIVCKIIQLFQSLVRYIVSNELFVKISLRI